MYIWRLTIGKTFSHSCIKFLCVSYFQLALCKKCVYVEMAVISKAIMKHHNFDFNLFCVQERTSQSRILDLESQLSALRAENARVKREREEAERKFNSRLYDLKDRLEQSHSTNRSMQNYVQFLKSSYANVFGDTTALAGSTPGRTTFPY